MKRITKKMIDRAEILLCQSDEFNSTADMIKAIAEHDNHEDLLCYVWGVIPWCHVEDSLNCGDFLRTIGYKY